VYTNSIVLKMKNKLLLFFLLSVALSCNSTKVGSLLQKENPNETIDYLKEITSKGCRYNGFSIGEYYDEESEERFGLDTIDSKYIWYSNKEEKIILNTFLQERYAVKYSLKQLNKVFPKSKGAMVVTINSKKTAEELIANLKKSNIEPTIVATFDDELGYSSEIDILACDSPKAELIIIEYPEVKFKYKK